MAASNAKLSLFYDWLFFDPEKDSIMNIGLYLVSNIVLLVFCCKDADHGVAPHALKRIKMDFVQGLATGKELFRGSAQVKGIGFG